MIFTALEENLLSDGYVLSLSKPDGEKVYYNADHYSRVHITSDSLTYYHQWRGLTRTLTTWSYGLYQNFSTWTEFKRKENDCLSTSSEVIYNEQFRPFGY